jgi:hypothetical protein
MYYTPRVVLSQRLYDVTCHVLLITAERAPQRNGSEGNQQAAAARWQHGAAQESHGQTATLAEDVSKKNQNGLLIGRFG